MGLSFNPMHLCIFLNDFLKNADYKDADQKYKSMLVSAFNYVRSISYVGCHQQSIRFPIPRALRVQYYKMNFIVRREFSLLPR